MAYAADRLGVAHLPLQLVKGFGQDANIPLGYWPTQRKLEFLGDAWFEAFIALNYPLRGEEFYKTSVNNFNLFLGIWKSGFLALLRRTGKSGLV
jgi:hypothetical protein